MIEHRMPIPSRAYNAAVGGHVCGPEDIDFGQKVVHLIKYDKDGNEVSFESQVTQANKIYVIHDDFTLSSNVTIPANCTLQFDGGSLNNGIINLNGCYINAGLNQIFNNVKLNNISTYNNALEVIDNIYIKTLSTNAFVNKKTNKLVPANTIINRRYIYRVTGSSNSTTIDGNDVKVTINGTTYIIAKVKDGIYTFNYNYSSIIGIVAETGNMASGSIDSLEGVAFYAISPISYSNISKISNKEIHPEWFGAKGDNVNDDSIAINTSLDLAHNSAKTVLLGSGTYCINDTLVVNSQVNFEGIIPVIENPIAVRLSANTDIAILIFDVKDHIGSFQIKNIGIVSHSSTYDYNFIGIKIYHFQNHANISKVGIRGANIGIDIDALYGVQMLRCEDISMLSVETPYTVAINIHASLQGWVNANYFRFACVEHCAAIKATCCGDNTLDGGAGYTESTSNFLIDLDNATFIIRGGLYKETGKIARLRNKSLLEIEGDSYLIGEIDCDNTSYIKNYPLLQSKVAKQNYQVTYNDVVLAHYKKFSKMPFLWHETISGKVYKPIETLYTYTTNKYNGRLYTQGYCKVPMGGINIKDKTIAIRAIFIGPFDSASRRYPLSFNFQDTDTTTFSQAKRVNMSYTSVLYGPGDIVECLLEKGEQYIFLSSKNNDYILNNIYPTGNSTFMISDIYVIDKPSNEIVGRERIRIIDILNSLDSYVNDDGFLLNYNKGGSNARPTDLGTDDVGFEYFDTTLGKPIYWNGSAWVDAIGTPV